ncbi:MAG: caspase family protein, partial [Bacteroidales bacterium]
GHGYPDETTQTPYLIPVDVDATNLQSAIKLSEVYAKFGETGAKSITVFLDACFSGGGRNQGLLSARGVRIKPKNENIRGNMVVFAATSGVQVALPFKEQKHGMFTYFLLKNMQETKGQFTLGQLDDYLRQNVGLESLRTNSKSQDPEVQASPAVENSWRNWTFQ